MTLFKLLRPFRDQTRPSNKICSISLNILKPQVKCCSFWLAASCFLPKERGSCRNYTLKWFFNMALVVAHDSGTAGKIRTKIASKLKKNVKEYVLILWELERWYLWAFFKWTGHAKGTFCSGTTQASLSTTSREECAEFSAKNETAGNISKPQLRHFKVVSRFFRFPLDKSEERILGLYNV